MDPKNRLNHDETRVNQTISSVRARPHRLTDSFVTMAHGSGGKASAALVEQVFFEAFASDRLTDGDSAVLPLAQLGLDAASTGGSLAMSTDSYVVNPIFFPGGSIGELAINGTVNDLAVAGARPLLITAAFVLEEGLPIDTLRTIAAAMRNAADAAGVAVVAGDTKVVPKGSCDQLYITTAGVGYVPADRRLGYKQVQPGDRVILSGPIADHGMAVMMARGDLALTAPIESDTRAVNSLVEALVAAAPGVRWMRDATRGGVATVMNELARGSGMGVALHDDRIPVRDLTRGACDVLGIDPLYVANEGTFLAVVPEGQAQAATQALIDAGAPQAAIIGQIIPEPAKSVVLVTGFGGTRMVDMLVGDPLPRIC